MDKKSSEYYSYILPEKHNKVALQAILLLLAFVIVGLAAWFLSDIFLPSRASPTSTSSTTLPPTANDPIISKKQIVLQRLSDISVKPLTQEERIDIIDFLSRGGATYTVEERSMITRALKGE